MPGNTAYIEIRVEGDRAREVVRNLRGELGGLEGEARRAGRGLDDMGGGARRGAMELGRVENYARRGAAGLGTLYSRLTSVGTLMTAGAAGYGVSRLVTSFAELDSGLIGVSKTTGITGKSLDDLGRDILDLSKTLPTSKAQLLAIAQAAGQLGVEGAANILEFTDTVAKLELATDMAGEAAAMQLARLLSVSREAADGVDELGAVIVSLGNSMEATESQIAKNALRVAQSSSVYNVASHESAALGATLKAMGVEAELGGSAVGRTMRTLDQALRQGGDALHALEELTGRTGEQLRKAFGENSVSVLQMFLEGLRQVKARGGDVAASLEQFGLKGQEVLQVLPALALGSDKLARALALANEQVEKGTALDEEALAASKSFTAQMTMAGNVIDTVAATMGRELAPAVVRTSKEFASWLDEHSGDLRDFAGDIAGLATDFAQFGGHVGDVFDFTLRGWDALPSVIQELGIVGALVGGVKGRLALGLIVGASGALTDMIELSKLAAEGKASWWTALHGFADPDEIREQSESIEGLREQIDRLRRRRSGVIYADEKREQIEQLERQLKLKKELAKADQYEGVVDLSRTKGDPAAGRDEALAWLAQYEDKAKKVEDDVLARRKDALREYKQATLDSHEFQQWSLRQTAAEKREAAEGDKETIRLVNAWETEALAELARKKAAHISEEQKMILGRVETHRDAWEMIHGVYDDQSQWLAEIDRAAINGAAEAAARATRRREKLRAEVSPAYKAQKLKQELDREHKALKGHVEDETALRIWHAQEAWEIERDRIKEEEHQRRDEYRRKAQQADSWLGYAANTAASESDIWKDEQTRRLEHWRRYYDHTEDLLRDNGQALQRTGSNVLFDWWKGEFRSMEEYTNQILDSMLRSMSEYATAMAAEWAGSQLMSWGSGLLDGLLSFHTGTAAIRQDEVVAKLQKDEMVIPAQQAEAVRQAVGGDGTSSSGFFDNVVGAVQVGSRVNPISQGQFSDYAMDSAFGLSLSGGDPSWVGEQMGRKRGVEFGHFWSGLFGGGLAAWNNYSRVQTLGEQLQDLDVAIPQDRINEVAKDAALTGFASSMFSGLAGWAGDLAAFGLGVEEYAMPARIANTALASLLGIGGAGILAAAATPLTAYAMSQVADWMGLRSHETFRDALEDQFGGLAGRQAYQSLSTSMPGIELCDGLEIGYVAPDHPALPHQVYSFSELAAILGESLGRQTGPTAEQMRMASGIYGLDFAQAVFSSAPAAVQQALAEAVMADTGFYSNETRAAAAQQVGGFVHGNTFYSGDGRMVDISDWSNVSFQNGQLRQGGGSGRDLGIDGGTSATSMGGREAHEMIGGYGDYAPGVGGYGGGGLGEPSTPGWREGGWTGWGPLNEVAGAVHRREYVVSSAGIDFLDSLLEMRVPDQLRSTQPGQAFSVASLEQAFVNALSRASEGDGGEKRTHIHLHLDSREVFEAMLPHISDAAGAGRVVISSGGVN
ncbi:phage tail tape measure protein [Desulfohalovibrio reitneri]|uniref:phage tail tape measure protein n=1 Tax=Desulfohalovibrio reitneri TaxID=1307759 RepID=UPI0004A7464C|nr:phage tail tape measure protein [Desulfohalovibrio reitneri]